MDKKNSVKRKPPMHILQASLAELQALPWWEELSEDSRNFVTANWDERAIIKPLTLENLEKWVSRTREHLPMVPQPGHMDVLIEFTLTDPTITPRPFDPGPGPLPEHGDGGDFDGLHMDFFHTDLDPGGGGEPGGGGPGGGGEPGEPHFDMLHMDVFGSRSDDTPGHLDFTHVDGDGVGPDGEEGPHQDWFHQDGIYENDDDPHSDDGGGHNDNGFADDAPHDDHTDGDNNHTDAHNDNDTFSDTHADDHGHTDSNYSDDGVHTDQPHSDAHSDSDGDGDFFDVSPWHGDDHRDQHGDSPYSDDGTHNDDGAHSDAHADSFADAHGDQQHGDEPAHGDNAHADHVDPDYTDHSDHGHADHGHNDAHYDWYWDNAVSLPYAGIEPTVRLTSIMAGLRSMQRVANQLTPRDGKLLHELNYRVSSMNSELRDLYEEMGMGTF